MTTHTPGPWKTFKGHDDEPDRWTVTTSGQKQWHIATIENGAPGDTLETEGSNAHLIAAAPAMLEALKALHRTLTTSTCVEMERIILKAIAQAEGQAVQP